MPDAATIEAPPTTAPTTTPPAAPPPVTAPAKVTTKPVSRAQAAADTLANRPGAAAAPDSTTQPKTAAEPSTTQPKPAAEPSTTAPAAKPADAPADADGEPTPEYKAALAKTSMPPEMAKFVLNKDGKVNPWKRAEWYEREFVKAKDEITKLRTSSLAEQEKSDYQKRIEKAETRVKEFEDEVRLTNYAKSEEFKEKFQKPYDAAWKRTMGELQGLTVPTEDGQTRPFTAQDMLQLVNLDAIPARKTAVELYGDFANDVMLHRNEIRRMADEQTAAIEDAKVKGAEREKIVGEARTKAQREISQTIEKTFKDQHKAALEDKENGRFFTPKEGDDEWNAALESGRKLTAQVFTDPDNPRLTSEERIKLVRAQAAVFNRSAAFGPMKRMVARLEKELAAVKKENEGFKASRPDAAGARQPAAANGQPARAIDRVMAAFPKGTS